MLSFGTHSLEHTLNWVPNPSAMLIYLGRQIYFYNLGIQLLNLSEELRYHLRLLVYKILEVIKWQRISWLEGLSDQWISTSHWIALLHDAASLDLNVDRIGTSRIDDRLVEILWQRRQRWPMVFREILCSWLSNSTSFTDIHGYWNKDCTNST